MQDIKEQFSGRWKSVLLSAGIDEKYLSGKHTPCIFCDGRDRARWIEIDEYYWCNHCSPMSPIDVYMRFTGLSFIESCNQIRGEKINYQKQQAIHKPDARILLKRVHSMLKPIRSGGLVDQYLCSRGLNERVHDIYEGYMPHYGGQKLPGMFSALVARITNVNGELQSYQLLYVGDDGAKLSASIPEAKDKIILPPIDTINGCSIKSPLNDGTVLAVAEGLSTAMSVQQNEGIPCFSSVSANGLEKIKIPDSVKTVYIYADSDSSFTGQAAAYNLAKRLSIKKLNVTVFIPEKVDTDFLDVFNEQ